MMAFAAWMISVVALSDAAVEVFAALGNHALGPWPYISTPADNASFSAFTAI